VEVITSTLERLVGGDEDLDIQVTGWPCTRSDLTLARELDPGAGVDPARDPKLEVAAGADATLARALEAGVGDDDAITLASSARARGHDLAEEGPLDLLDLASAPADVAGAGARAGLRPVAMTGSAGDRGVDCQLLFGTEDRL
jgi:hypothetical protein